MAKNFMEKTAVIKGLGLMRILKYEQVPSQVITELAKKGIVKNVDETMDEFTNRVIEAYKKEF
jgi:hypothetical protein